MKTTKGMQKERKKIIAYSMASNKMVGLVHVRGRKKEIEPFLIDEK